MNTCVSRRSFTLRNRARTHPAAAHQNPAPLPMLPRAAPRGVRSLIFRRQYCLRSCRAWQRGKQGVAPFAPWAVRLQQLRFRPVCSRAKDSTTASQPTRALTSRPFVASTFPRARFSFHLLEAPVGAERSFPEDPVIQDYPGADRSATDSGKNTQMSDQSGTQLAF
jgi:hypothetical protein